MKKLKGIESGEIGVIELSSLLTEIWGNMSIISLNTVEMKIILHNIAKLRKFIRGRRDFNVLNYSPMKIERELEQIEFHYRHRFLDIIILSAKRNIYNLKDFKEFDALWDDFIVVHKYEYGEIPEGWDGWSKAEKASLALTEIILEALKTELEKNPGKTKKHNLLLYLSGVKVRYNFSKAPYKEAEKLLKNMIQKTNTKISGSKLFKPKNKRVPSRTLF